MRIMSLGLYFRNVKILSYEITNHVHDLHPFIYLQSYTIYPMIRTLALYSQIITIKLSAILKFIFSFYLLFDSLVWGWTLKTPSLLKPQKKYIYYYNPKLRLMREIP